MLNDVKHGALETQHAAQRILEALRAAQMVQSMMRGQLRWRLDAFLDVPWKRNLKASVEIAVETRLPTTKARPIPMRVPGSTSALVFVVDEPERGDGGRDPHGAGGVRGGVVLHLGAAIHRVHFERRLALEQADADGESKDPAKRPTA